MTLFYVNYSFFLAYCRDVGMYTASYRLHFVERATVKSFVVC